MRYFALTDLSTVEPSVGGASEEVYLADDSGEARLSDVSPGDFFFVPFGDGFFRLNDSPTGAATLVRSGAEVKVQT
jgi:hypothetical protein